MHGVGEGEDKRTSSFFFLIYCEIIECFGVRILGIWFRFFFVVVVVV